jgi:hypothetical protein
MVDHLEFPSYTISEVFGCFCEACRKKAAVLGYAFDELKSGAKEAYEHLAGLSSDCFSSNGMLDAFAKLVGNPKLWNWLRFKVESLNALFEDAQKVTKEIDSRLELDLDCVTASFCLLSGVHLGKLSGYGDFVNPKLYLTNDFWGWRGRISEYFNSLSKLNPKLSEKATLQLLFEIFGMQLLMDKRDLKEIMNTPFTQKVLSSEVRKNLGPLGDRKKLRPWIRLDMQLGELENLLRALSESDVEGVLIRSYEVATTEKLDAVRRLFAR